MVFASKLSRNCLFLVFPLQQAKEMVMELIRDQGFREQRGEYGSRLGGDSLDVSSHHLSFFWHYVKYIS